MKDKETTKKRLIEAVGELIRIRGFKGLRISIVARQADVDRKLIYRYFGNLNNLIEAYIVEKDYWMIFADHLKHLLRELDTGNSQDLVTTILQEQFKFFFEQKEMQQLILMELSEKNPMMKSIHNARENMGQGFFAATDAHFENTSVNFRAVAALLVGGIYYIILHTRDNGYQFAGIDLKKDEGVHAILDAIAKVVDWAYSAAVQS